MRNISHKPAILIGLSFFVATFMAPCIEAKILYVGDNDPYKTISAAISAADSGDVIIVRLGDSSENVLINKALTVRTEHGKNHFDFYGTIEIWSSHVTIEGFMIRPLMSEEGILIGDENTPFSNITIQNNTIEERNFGIKAPNPGCINIQIRDNLIESCYTNGLFLKGCGGFVITGDTIQLSGTAGIIINDGSGACIQSSIISGNYGNGIRVLEEGVDNTVTIDTGNEIAYNTNDGLFLQGSAIVQDNTILENGAGFEDKRFDGVSISGPAIIQGNSIKGNFQYGIQINETTTNVNITENNIESNAKSGILIQRNSSATIETNSIINNLEGIAIKGSATVENNTINSSHLQAIFIAPAASNVTLNGNTMENNNIGVNVFGGASDVNLTDNSIRLNSIGLSTAAAVKLRSNLIEDNQDQGVSISHAGTDLGQDNETEAGMNIIQYNENWNVVNNTSEVITAYRNYWGLTEANEIDAKIKDDNEDASTGPVQFNPFLTDNPTIVESAHRVLPTQYSLEQNYPNPFNLNTHIFITLPVTNEVSLFIHDINGRPVDTIHLGKLYAGSHIFTWNASKISSGLYFITLKTERFNKVIKCTLLK